MGGIARRERTPTAAETRLLAYLPLIAGAAGLQYYVRGAGGGALGSPVHAPPRGRGNINTHQPVYESNLTLGPAGGGTQYAASAWSEARQVACQWDRAGGDGRWHTNGTERGGSCAERVVERRIVPATVSTHAVFSGKVK